MGHRTQQLVSTICEDGTLELLRGCKDPEDARLKLREFLESHKVVQDAADWDAIGSALVQLQGLGVDLDICRYLTIKDRDERRCEARCTVCSCGIFQESCCIRGDTLPSPVRV